MIARAFLLKTTVEEPDTRTVFIIGSLSKVLECRLRVKPSYLR
jgi:hypothetical protein